MSGCGPNTKRELPPIRGRGVEGSGSVVGQMCGPTLKKRKTALLKRDGWRCWLCGEFMGEGDVSIDHLLPRSLGGTHEQANLKLAHVGCNNRRGLDMSVVQALEPLADHER